MNKEKFKDFCNKNQDLPIFLSYKWAEIVADTENSWDVLLEEKGGKIYGFLLYFKYKNKGLQRIENPFLTPYTGLYFLHPKGQKNHTRLSFEKKTANKLIDQLPHFHHLNIKLHPSIENWLPFYWKGFAQTCRYTFIIQNTDSEDKLFAGFRDNIRWDINKAAKSLSIEETNDADTLYLHKLKDYKQKGEWFPIPYNYIRNLISQVTDLGIGKVLYARDSRHNIHASILLVWDAKSYYYLFGAADPDFKNSGATSLLIWEGIKMASSESKSFDFEGSMIEPINRFFAGFGGDLIPYHTISKTPSGIFRTYQNMKKIL